MNYEEAKKYAAEHPNATIYMARYDGRVWSAGRMVDVGEVISYHTNEADAKKACEDYELVDFDSEHCYTSVEKCMDGEFDD